MANGSSRSIPAGSIPGYELVTFIVLPGEAEGFATMERAGAPMFNDMEEMAEAAGLLARYPILRKAAKPERLPTVFFNDRRGA